MPSPPSYGCCTRTNFVLKKHLLFQMNLSNSGLKNRSIKEYWLIFTVLKFPLGLQFSHNLTKGQGSRRVKIGPVTKINEIWLYCMCMSSVNENDSF